MSLDLIPLRAAARRHGASIALHIVPPAPISTLNQRLHWRTVATRKRSWREVAKWTALKLPPPGLDTPPPPARWVCTVSYPTDRPNTRRDPHNWILTSKWIIDGIVDSGLIADDDSRHLVVADAQFHLRSTNGCVVVALDPEVSGG